LEATDNRQIFMYCRLFLYLNFPEFCPNISSIDPWWRETKVDTNGRCFAVCSCPKCKKTWAENEVSVRDEGYVCPFCNNEHFLIERQITFQEAFCRKLFPEIALAEKPEELAYYDDMVRTLFPDA